MKKSLIAFAAFALLTLSFHVAAPSLAYADDDSAAQQLEDANDSGQAAVVAPTDEESKADSNQVFDGN
jgi:hypothetical protein